MFSPLDSGRKALLSAGSSVPTENDLLFLNLEYVHLGKSTFQKNISSCLVSYFIRLSDVSLSEVLWGFLFLQMLQNLKLELWETSPGYVTESSGNPEPAATVFSGLGNKTLVHAQCHGENDWDKTFDSFHLVFDR